MSNDKMSIDEYFSTKKNIEGIDVYHLELLFSIINDFKERLDDLLNKSFAYRYEGDVGVGFLNDIHIHCTSDEEGGYLRIALDCGNKTLSMLKEDNPEIPFSEKEEKEYYDYTNIEREKKD